MKALETSAARIVAPHIHTAGLSPQFATRAGRIERKQELTEGYDQISLMQGDLHPQPRFVAVGETVAHHPSSMAGQPQPEKKTPEPSQETRAPSTVSWGEHAPSTGGPGGSPPQPPRDQRQSGLFISSELQRAAERAWRSRRNAALLSVLAAIAAGAVAAGFVAQSEGFWVSAGTVFTAAFVGLVAYVVKELGVFAETAALLGRAASSAQAGERGRGAAEVHVAATPEEHGAFVAAKELADARLEFDLFSDLIEPDDFRRTILDKEKQLLERAVSAGEIRAAALLGQTLVMLEAPAEAESVYVNAANAADPLAFYELGCLHEREGETLHKYEWWLEHANRGSPLACYFVGRHEQRQGMLSSKDRLEQLPPGNAG